VTDVGDDVVRVELENTRPSRRNDTRFLDTSFFASPVALITPSRKGSAFVVDIKLNKRVPYKQKVEGNMLAIDFERPAGKGGQAPEEAAPAEGLAAPPDEQPEAEGQDLPAEAPAENPPAR
jgi:hypothetical protein